MEESSMNERAKVYFSLPSILLRSFVIPLFKYPAFPLFSSVCLVRDMRDDEVDMNHSEQDGTGSLKMGFQFNIIEGMGGDDG
jgi:hypothetical protein